MVSENSYPVEMSQMQSFPDSWADAKIVGFVWENLNFTILYKKSPS